MHTYREKIVRLTYYVSLLMIRSNIDTSSILSYSVSVKETLNIETERVDDIPLLLAHGGIVMSEIRIQLFGRCCVRRDGQVVADLEADKLQELFGYLLLHRRSAHARESLASLLWPETTTAHAKKRLRQLLWLLQSALGSHAEAPPDRLLLVTTDQVQINPEANFWLDVAVFEKTFACIEGVASQRLGTQHVQALHNAVQSYRGPLLEGCYEDWCLYERERLQNMYLVMLEKLMNYSEGHQDYEIGIQYGMRIIACDKIHERTYRRLMRLHYLNGNRAKALHFYEQCTHALNEELGVKPSQRTTALYKQVLSEHLVVPEPSSTPANTQRALGEADAPLIEALDHLTHLQEILTDLQNQIQQSVQHVERSLSKNSSPAPSTKTNGGEDAPETFS
jgi:DNA-binding SARP family transcriptional activator